MLKCEWLKTHVMVDSVLVVAMLEVELSLLGVGLGMEWNERSDHVEEPESDCWIQREEQC